MKPTYKSTPFKVVITAARGLQLGLLLATVVFLSACAEKTTLSKRHDSTGIYTLVSVNATKVPATVSHEGAQLRVLSGTFTINSDGTCGSKMIFVPPSGTESTREVKATYTQD